MAAESWAGDTSDRLARPAAPFLARGRGSCPGLGRSLCSREQAGGQPLDSAPADPAVPNVGHDQGVLFRVGDPIEELDQSLRAGAVAHGGEVPPGTSDAWN